MYILCGYNKKKTNDFVVKYLQVNTLLLIRNQFYDIFMQNNENLSLNN